MTTPTNTPTDRADAAATRTCVIAVAPSPTGPVNVTLDAGAMIPRLVRRSERAATVALVAGGAMLLPGDSVCLQIHVADGCSLTLDDIGGMVVYGRPGDGIRSLWHAEITVGVGADVTWNALPTVIAEDAALERHTLVTLAAGARAEIRETLVLGRTGERGGLLDAVTNVDDAGGAVLRERLVAHGHEPTAGVLGTHRVMDTRLYLGDGGGAVPPPVDGATRLTFERGGAMDRWLGDEAHGSVLG